MEITLNSVHPYEYNPKISSYEGVLEQPFDFMRHPIALSKSCYAKFALEGSRDRQFLQSTKPLTINPPSMHLLWQLMLSNTNYK